MSDFLAEARVLIRPDTTKFRALLAAEVLAATRSIPPVAIPVTPVVTAGNLAALSAQSTAAAAGIREVNAANIAGAEAARRSAQETAEQTRRLGQLERGGIATAASLAGLRGAVLAASTPFIVGTVAATAFAKAVGAAANLETQLNTFRVTVGATADEMERAAEQAKALGRDITLPGVSAQDAAQAFTELAKAGLSVEDALAGARGVLQLATAAQIDNASATELAASALNAFQLSGEEALHVADLLTNAANEAQGSIADMGLALRQTAGIADLVGFSLDETVSLLTILARAGLRGSDAGTSLRVALLRLINPTKEAQAQFEKLNLNLRDAQGNLRPEVFFELSDALERMSKAQQQATLATIFGADASRAAAFLGRENIGTFRDLTVALGEQGSAAEQAGARMSGLSGSAENLKNQLSALGTEIGQLSLPVLTVGVDVAAEFFGLLATQISDSRKALAGFGDDISQLGEFLDTVSRDSGFTDFISDVSSGAKLLAGDIQRASGAVDSFSADLLGVGDNSDQAVRSIHELTQEERDFALSLTDSHDRVSIQVQDLEKLATAAQQAAGSISRLEGQIAGLSEQVTRARITGDQGAELQLLEQERERLKRLLAIQEGIVAEGGTGAATARRRIREQILPQLESVTNEIRAITQEQVRQTEEVAREAEQARQERDQNILDALGAREQRRTNAVIEAQATESLQDDLKAQIALRNFFRNSIVEIRKTVRDGKTAASAIAAATQDLINAQRDIEDTRRELREQRRTQRREERERLRESLSLDVQIAQATGNRGAEIRARQAEIEFLKRQIRQTREGSNQRKRLILELRQAQKELIELRGERQKTSQAFQEMTFEFLQRQQGFAANLLGNLIPGFATGGLVGGTQPTTAAIRPPDVGVGIAQESAIAGGRDLGFSRGQGNETNALLRAILRSIESLNGRTGHPEARYQKATQSAFMDVIGT